MRTAIRMLTCVGILTVVGKFACAAGVTTDTSKVPRLNSVQQVYASPAVTILKSTLPVASAAEAIRKMLHRQGWRYFEAPFSSKAANSPAAHLTFKKGGRAITVMVSALPSPAKATNIQYIALPLHTDLPFPADATAIKFSSDRPYLKCYTSGSLDRLVAFFGGELGNQGWEAWSPEKAAKIRAGRPIARITPNAAFSYFVKIGNKPIRLSLVTQKDARVLVIIDHASPSEMNLPHAREKARLTRLRDEEQKKAARAKAQTAFQKRQSNFDAMSADVMRKALQGAVPGSIPTPIAVSQKLTPLANNKVPVPLPNTAQDIAFDAVASTLAYSSPSSVAAIAAFHRSVMKQAGWREQRSVINRPNIVVMNFSKNGKKLSLTVMQTGAVTNISGNGTALSAPAAASESGKPNSVARTSIQQLDAEDKGGLPVPKPYTSSGSERTLFRMAVNATVSADVNSVLAFYRRELAKKSWAEDKGGFKISKSGATIRFAAPQGPAVLTVNRKGSRTDVVLLLRNRRAAQKSGLMPGNGRVTILFGNTLKTESVVTVGGKTIKVGAGVGTKRPDGPHLELKPGKYTVSLKVRRGHPAREPINVGPDSIWGIIIGPGGVLPIPIY